MKRSAAAVTGTVVTRGGSAAPAFADAVAQGAATGSRGLLSGDVAQVPVHARLPVTIPVTTAATP
ncbi:chaplin family protein [Streptomyces sp. NPDC052020]|uniref:chaplin family protein n=1 Tax=Streptomyces sp. NPDC052020 TaxID=3155677 RepID=UPI0034350562